MKSAKQLAQHIEAFEFQAVADYDKSSYVKFIFTDDTSVILKGENASKAVSTVEAIESIFNFLDQDPDICVEYAGLEMPVDCYEALEETFSEVTEA